MYRMNFTQLFLCIRQIIVFQTVFVTLLVGSYTVRTDPSYYGFSDTHSVRTLCGNNIKAIHMYVCMYSSAYFTTKKFSQSIDHVSSKYHTVKYIKS